MHEEQADRDAVQLRAEAVAMLSEQAALCGGPPPAGSPERPAAGPGRVAVTAPPSTAATGADTAALLRELSSLGGEPVPAPPPVAPPAEGGPRRAGLFGRRPRGGR